MNRAYVNRAYVGRPCETFPSAGHDAWCPYLSIGTPTAFPHSVHDPS